MGWLEKQGQFYDSKAARAAPKAYKISAIIWKIDKRYVMIMYDILLINEDVLMCRLQLKNSAL